MSQNTKYQGELLGKSQKFLLAQLIHLGFMQLYVEVCIKEFKDYKILAKGVKQDKTLHYF